MSDKILVIGPNWIGDLVMAQSLFKVMKDLYTQARIDVIAPPWCQPLLARMPEVNDGIALPVSHGELGLARRYHLGRTLRARGYQRAIIIPRTFKSALVPFFARIPQRSGYRGEMRYGFINDIRPRRASRGRPMIERHLRLVTDDPPAHPPQPALRIDRQAQRETLQRLALRSDGVVVGFAAGAEAGPAKRWPIGRFAELANMLDARGAGVWVFGSAKEHSLGEEIVAQARTGNIVNLCGQTTLPEAVDLLACCETVVANDSGLMHVAAAAGCRVVGLYGSTSPLYTPPLTGKSKIIYHELSCSPCFKRECPFGHYNCLKGISAREVLESLDATAPVTNAKNQAVPQ